MQNKFLILRPYCRLLTSNCEYFCATIHPQTLLINPVIQLIIRYLFSEDSRCPSPVHIKAFSYSYCPLKYSNCYNKRTSTKMMCFHLKRLIPKHSMIYPHFLWFQKLLLFFTCNAGVSSAQNSIIRIPHSKLDSADTDANHLKKPTCIAYALDHHKLTTPGSKWYQNH